MIFQPVRGTHDILGNEARLKLYIQDLFFNVCRLYNFNYIETPIFESTNVFKRTLGETSDVVGKEMYSFEDRGGDSLTLRPEGTAPVVRALISNGLTQTLPQRFFYMGPMFRYERPQKGRCRQFHQACVEYIGSSNPYADVEVIALGHQLLKELNIEGLTLHINTLGDEQSRLSYRSALIDYFSQYKDDLSDDSKIRLEKNPLRILDSKDKNDQKICEEAPSFSDYLNDSSKIFYDSVLNGLNVLNINYKKDETLVRGLDYYTHTAFEFKTTALGAQDTVLAGGRYDNLVKQMGGPSIPAVGFGMGIERLILLLEDKKLDALSPVGIIPLQEDDFEQGLKIASSLRSNGFSVEFPLNGNIGKRFKQLEKMNCKLAIVFGEDERTSGVVKLKFLYESVDQPKEQIVHLGDLAQKIKGLDKK